VREETLGVILRGHPASLGKALRMLRCMIDIRVIYSERSQGKLWIRSDRDNRPRRNGVRW